MVAAVRMTRFFIALCSCARCPRACVAFEMVAYALN